MDDDAGKQVEDTFLKVLSANLRGKRWTRFLKLLKFNLKCVNRGLKPSYLWDMGPGTDSQTIAKLIGDLKSVQLMASSIYVLCYENEVFIVNLETVGTFLNEFPVKFVDTDSKSEPKLVDNDLTCRLITSFKCKFENFLHQHERNLLPSQTCLPLKFDLDLYPPSVFGLLLGYPVVYWNFSKNDSNNLCFQPLCVYEVIWETGSVYKFSVPVLLNLDSFVKDWLNRLKEALSVNLNLSVEKVVLPCVQL